MIELTVIVSVNIPSGGVGYPEVQEFSLHCTIFASCSWVHEWRSNNVVRIITVCNT